MDDMCTWYVFVGKWSEGGSFSEHCVLLSHGKEEEWGSAHTGAVQDTLMGLGVCATGKTTTQGAVVEVISEATTVKATVFGLAEGSYLDHEATRYEFVAHLNSSDWCLLGAKTACNRKVTGGGRATKCRGCFEAGETLCLSTTSATPVKAIGESGWCVFCFFKTAGRRINRHVKSRGVRTAIAAISAIGVKLTSDDAALKPKKKQLRKDLAVARTLLNRAWGEVFEACGMPHFKGWPHRANRSAVEGTPHSSLLRGVVGASVVLPTNTPHVAHDALRKTNSLPVHPIIRHPLEPTSVFLPCVLSKGKGTPRQSSRYRSCKVTFAWPQESVEYCLIDARTSVGPLQLDCATPMSVLEAWARDAMESTVNHEDGEFTFCLKANGDVRHLVHFSAVSVVHGGTTTPIPLLHSGTLDNSDANVFGVHSAAFACLVEGKSVTAFETAGDLLNGNMVVIGDVSEHYAIGGAKDAVSSPHQFVAGNEGLSLPPLFVRCKKKVTDACVEPYVATAGASPFDTWLMTLCKTMKSYHKPDVALLVSLPTQVSLFTPYGVSSCHSSVRLPNGMMDVRGELDNKSKGRMLEMVPQFEPFFRVSNKWSVAKLDEKWHAEFMSKAEFTDGHFFQNVNVEVSTQEAGTSYKHLFVFGGVVVVTIETDNIIDFKHMKWTDAHKQDRVFTSGVCMRGMGDYVDSKEGFVRFHTTSAMLNETIIPSPREDIFGDLLYDIDYPEEDDGDYFISDDGEDSDENEDRERDDGTQTADSDDNSDGDSNDRDAKNVAPKAARSPAPKTPRRASAAKSALAVTPEALPATPTAANIVCTGRYMSLMNKYAQNFSESGKAWNVPELKRPPRSTSQPTQHVVAECFLENGSEKLFDFTLKSSEYFWLEFNDSQAMEIVGTDDLPPFKLGLHGISDGRIAPHLHKKFADDNHPALDKLMVTCWHSTRSKDASDGRGVELMDANYSVVDDRAMNFVGKLLHIKFVGEVLRECEAANTTFPDLKSENIGYRTIDGVPEFCLFDTSEMILNNDLGDPTLNDNFPKSSVAMGVGGGVAIYNLLKEREHEKIQVGEAAVAKPREEFDGEMLHIRHTILNMMTCAAAIDRMYNVLTGRSIVVGSLPGSNFNWVCTTAIDTTTTHVADLFSDFPPVDGAPAAVGGMKLAKTVLVKCIRVYNEVARKVDYLDEVDSTNDDATPKSRLKVRCRFMEKKLTSIEYTFNRHPVDTDGQQGDNVTGEGIADEWMQLAADTGNLMKSLADLMVSVAGELASVNSAPTVPSPFHVAFDENYGLKKSAGWLSDMLGIDAWRQAEIASARKRTDVSGGGCFVSCRNGAIQTVANLTAERVHSATLMFNTTRDVDRLAKGCLFYTTGKLEGDVPVKTFTFGENGQYWAKANHREWKTAKGLWVAIELIEGGDDTKRNLWDELIKFVHKQPKEEIVLMRMRGACGYIDTSKEAHWRNGELYYETRPYDLSSTSDEADLDDDSMVGGGVNDSLISVSSTESLQDDLGGGVVGSVSPLIGAVDGTDEDMDSVNTVLKLFRTAVGVYYAQDPKLGRKKKSRDTVLKDKHFVRWYPRVEPGKNEPDREHLVLCQYTLMEGHLAGDPRGCHAGILDDIKLTLERDNAVGGNVSVITHRDKGPDGVVKEVKKVFKVGSKKKSSWAVYRYNNTGTSRPPPRL